jgi:hypothetical protein
VLLGSIEPVRGGHAPMVSGIYLNAQQL